MAENKGSSFESPIGLQEADSSGSPVSVVRMDTAKSYDGVGELLQKYIDDEDAEAWQKISAKIDYTFENLDLALGPLADLTNLKAEISARLNKGQKLLFKPNTVFLQNIDPITHGPGPSNAANTEWAFIAALMRWFHDKLGISYHQMSLGEAATAMPAFAGRYTLINPEKKPVTVEAALEGRSGNFYGGWGFYFARKYLADSSADGADDNPMNGFEESVTGTYIPPGQVTDKLMVYDLNRIFDDESKGREVPVPGGVNYDTITLHKAVIGGDPEDEDDRKAYPGCILINVPKLKVHTFTLLTNIIKNLGIGLYPMQFAKAGGHKWDYSVPHNPHPGMKAGIPHEVWVPEMDLETNLPKRDENGGITVHKTGGINATMIDIVKSVQNQDILMVHVVDGIQAINIDHTGTPMAVPCPEGLVVAGLDPVAADLLSARYMFSNAPSEDAFREGLEDGHGGLFLQAVPIPKVEGGNIVTTQGYDNPLSRDSSFQQAEARGLGQRKYYAFGRDVVEDAPIVSLKGHLGFVKNGRFNDIITSTLFVNGFKFTHDMQKTAFSYMEAVDQLTGSTVKADYLKDFDEDGDGIISYEEFGKKGAVSGVLHSGGSSLSRMATDKFSLWKRGFSGANMMKNSNSAWNSDGRDIYSNLYVASGAMAAYRMSLMEIEGQDPFLPGLTWGNGKWPSLELAKFFQMGMVVYGPAFPMAPGFGGMYATALYYADYTQNGCQYSGDILTVPNMDGVGAYLADVQSGKEKPLDFTFYVPEGFETLAGAPVPNVEASSDPARIFTVSFEGGKEIWP